MNNQIKEEGLTDAYLLGKYDGIKQGRADSVENIKKLLKEGLSVSIEHYREDGEYIKIKVFFDDELICSSCT